MSDLDWYEAFKNFGGPAILEKSTKS